MRTETGNLNTLRENNPERRGWIIGEFVSRKSLMYSENCEVKWAFHLKGLKKSSGADLDINIRTVIILVSGKWLTRFMKSGKEIVISNPGDYLVYEGAQHENEALEDTQVVVIRWQNKRNEE